MKKEKCQFCGRKLTKKDYYSLCRKCQPAYSGGREAGRKGLIEQIRAILDDA